MNEKPRFEILERIGHGQFSNVYKARWINAPLTPTNTWFPSCNNDQQLIDTNLVHTSPLGPSQQCNNTNSSNTEQGPNQTGSEKYVALKRIKICDIQNSKLRMDSVKEVKLLQQLKHPNIINYNISFIERNELFIVLELADGGDLSKLIRYFLRRQQLLSQRTILKYFTQICSAVSYIHSKRIMHRDIKPANIFMTSDGCVKLGDFGLGKFFSPNTLDAHSIVGTFYYMSPERICKSVYGFSSDIWSLGCVLYELMTLHSPFSILNNNSRPSAPARPSDNTPTSQHDDQHQRQHHQDDRNAPSRFHHKDNNGHNTLNLQWLIDRIIRADYPTLSPYNHVTPRLRQLATECLNPDPEGRPDMEYICSVVDSEVNISKQATSIANNTTAFMSKTSKDI